MYIWKRKILTGERLIVINYEILEFLGETEKWAEFSLQKIQEWVPITGQRTELNDQPIIFISVPKFNLNDPRESMELLPTFKAFRDKWLREHSV